MHFGFAIVFHAIKHLTSAGQKQLNRQAFCKAWFNLFKKKKNKLLKINTKKIKQEPDEIICMIFDIILCHWKYSLWLNYNYKNVNISQGRNVYNIYILFYHHNNYINMVRGSQNLLNKITTIAMTKMRQEKCPHSVYLK